MKVNIRGIALAILGNFSFFGYFLLRFDRSGRKEWKQHMPYKQ